MLARGIDGNGQFGRDFTVGEASRNQAQHDCLTCGEFQYGSPSTIERHPLLCHGSGGLL